MSATSFAHSAEGRQALSTIVVKDGGVIRRNKKTYMPGASLDVPEKEAERLIAIGAARPAEEGEAGEPADWLVNEPEPTEEQEPEETAVAEKLEEIESKRQEEAEPEKAEAIAETAEKLGAALESLTVAQLKETLAERGVEIPKDARKAELVELLQAAKQKE